MRGKSHTKNHHLASVSVVVSELTSLTTGNKYTMQKNSDMRHTKEASKQFIAAESISTFQHPLQ